MTLREEPLPAFKAGKPPSQVDPFRRRLLPSSAARSNVKRLLRVCGAMFREWIDAELQRTDFSGQDSGRCAGPGKGARPIAGQVPSRSRNASGARGESARARSEAGRETSSGEGPTRSQ